MPSNESTSYVPPINFEDKRWEHFENKGVNENNATDIRPEGIFYSTKIPLDTDFGDKNFQFNFKISRRQAEEYENSFLNRVHPGLNVFEDFPGLAVYIARNPEKITQSLEQFGKDIPANLIAEALFCDRNYIVQSGSTDIEETKKFGIKSLMPSNLDIENGKDTILNQNNLEDAVRRVLSSGDKDERLPKGFGLWEPKDKSKNYIRIIREDVEGIKNKGVGSIKIYLNDMLNGTSPNEQNIKSVFIDIAGKEVEIPRERWGVIAGFVRPEKGVTIPNNEQKTEEPENTNASKPDSSNKTEPKSEGVKPETETDEEVIRRIIAEMFPQMQEEVVNTIAKQLGPIITEMQTSIKELREEVEKLRQEQTNFRTNNKPSEENRNEPNGQNTQNGNNNQNWRRQTKEGRTPNSDYQSNRYNSKEGSTPTNQKTDSKNESESKKEPDTRSNEEKFESWIEGMNTDTRQRYYQSRKDIIQEIGGKIRSLKDKSKNTPLSDGENNILQSLLRKRVQLRNEMVILQRIITMGKKNIA